MQLRRKCVEKTHSSRSDFLGSSFDRRIIALVSASVLLCAVVVGLLCVVYVNRMQTLMEENSDEYLDEISLKMSVNIDNITKIQFSVLQTVAKLIGQSCVTMDEARAVMAAEKKEWGYEHMAIISADGDWHLEDGGTAFPNTSGLVARAVVLDEPAIEASVPIGGEDSMAIAVPMEGAELDGIKAEALAAIYTSDMMNELYSLETFEGTGYAYIVRRDGSVIVRTSHKDAPVTGYNVLAFLKSAEMKNGDYEKIVTDISRGVPGHIAYTLDGQKKYLNYVPLSVGDWCLLTVVPMDSVNARTTAFVRTTANICIFLTLFFALTLLGVMFLQLENKRKLEKIAYTDLVTGGRNQARFEMEAQSLLRENKKDYVLLYSNIDKFKFINDLLGTRAGDAVLEASYKAYNAMLGEHETMGRITGDHFAMLIKDSGWHDIEKRLSEAEREIDAQLAKLNIKYRLGYSYGLYSLGEEGRQEHVATMLGRANMARKQGECRGESINYYVYDDGMRRLLLREKELEDKMAAALEHRRFVAYYQPKFALSGGTETVAGAEALVRWLDPAEGVISPGDFIPLFERNGFVMKLDIYVFEEVCRTLHDWLASGVQPVPISINLSQRHMGEERFLDAYWSIIEKYGVPPDLIEFEFTETLVYEQKEKLKETVEEIHSRGCRCSIDDFGSGYSSLNLLKDMDADVLKLDKAFFDVRDDGSWRGSEIVLGVLQLARRLNMKTVAEGVERAEQVVFLRKAKCDMVQGYVFSQPMPQSDFDTLLRKGLNEAESS